MDKSRRKSQKENHMRTGKLSGYLNQCLRVAEYDMYEDELEEHHFNTEARYKWASYFGGCPMFPIAGAPAPPLNTTPAIDFEFTLNTFRFGHGEKLAQFDLHCIKLLEAQRASAAGGGSFVVGLQTNFSKH